MSAELNKEVIGSRKQMAVILMGSEHDEEHCRKITNVLDQFGVAHDLRVSSAHKTLHAGSYIEEGLSDIVKGYLEKQGEYEYVFITAAGLSNALSGVVKGLLSEANPPIRVIAAPPFNELDIWSSLRMPYGVSVSVFADPRNAALSAVEEFAKSNSNVASKYLEFIRDLQQAVSKADAKFRNK